ncbi:DCC1-like thiol-disulfide oxidoreductase family protein [Nonomuraea sp. NPDC047529]|uniref:thiol-disulfide oxidoreductase DCC family protein n=1 Tax=Nonomuraea sp. NPDC047529 TaxID=3155623 RepID=UPI0033D1E07B
MNDRLQDPRGTLIFDGDCGFCTSVVRLLSRHVAPGVDYRPWQREDLDALALTIEQVTREVWWLHPAETRAGGARAFARVLRHGRRPWPIAGRLMELRPIAAPAALVYRWIARNRSRLPGGTPACRL